MFTLHINPRYTTPPTGNILGVLVVYITIFCNMYLLNAVQQCNLATSPKNPCVSIIIYQYIVCNVIDYFIWIHYWTQQCNEFVLFTCFPFSDVPNSTVRVVCNRRNSVLNRSDIFVLVLCLDVKSRRLESNCPHIFIKIASDIVSSRWIMYSVSQQRR